MTRAERERKAQQDGNQVDAMFSNICRRLGLDIKTARAAPIASIATAEAERDAEKRRRQSAAVCGND